MRRRTEKWKKIEELSGYFISNLGRIKSVRFGRVLILKTPISTTGYKVFYVRPNPKRLQFKKAFKVHRLVAKYFIENTKKDNNIVNHLDGNKLNNNVENLEWTTKSEDIKHAYRIGLRKKRLCGFCHPLYQQNKKKNGK